MSGFIIDDANHPAVEGGVYHIAYGELVNGYRHAYEAPADRHGYRTVVRYSRTPSHPPDPRCPECAVSSRPPADTDTGRGQ